MAQARPWPRERQLIIDLRANARPVFLTGDFNDREKAFCGITTGKLAITPDSIPSMECAYPPKYYWVDWIFAAGQARFTTLSVDTSTRPKQDQRPPAGRLPHAPRGLTSDVRSSGPPENPDACSSG